MKKRPGYVANMFDHSVNNSNRLDDFVRNVLRGDNGHREGLDWDNIDKHLVSLSISPELRARLLMMQLNQADDVFVERQLAEAILSAHAPDMLCKELIEYCPPTVPTLRALAYAAARLKPHHPIGGLIETDEHFEIITVFDGLKAEVGVDFYPPAGIAGAPFTEAFGVLIEDPLNGFSSVLTSGWKGKCLRVTFENATFGYSEAAFIVRPFLFVAKR